MKKNCIRIISNLARSGGTLLAKCVGSMDNIVLLSEIHPSAKNIYDPILQAQQWYEFLQPDDLENKDYRFDELIEHIYQKCQINKKDLVIRDWAHLDFFGIPFLDKPLYRSQLTECLSGRFKVIEYAIVRNPIDQWLSTSTLKILNGKLSLEAFLFGYRKFAERIAAIGFIRYEDFTKNPEQEMQKICTHLRIKYDKKFINNWINYKNITGDVSNRSRGSEKSEIVSLPRKPIDKDILDKIYSNKDYQTIIKLLGYDELPDIANNKKNKIINFNDKKGDRNQKTEISSRVSGMKKPGSMSNTHALLSQGVTFCETQQFDEALICFNQVLDHDPDDVNALHLSGLVYAQRGNLSEAEKLIGKAISLKPTESIFHINLGNALLNGGQTARAIESYKKALQLKPSNTDTLSLVSSACQLRFKEATKSFNDSNFDEAEHACQQILDVRPDQADVWHLWGVIAYTLNDAIAGIERIHRAIAISPSIAVYHNSLGVLLGKEGQHEVAADCYRRALTFDENLVDANFNLALAQQALGNLESAITSFNKVISLDPNNVTAYRILASIFRVTGRYDEAMIAARKATELGPEDAHAFNELALLLRSLSHISEAVSACEKSLELYPDEASTHNTMGILLKEQGRPKECYASFRKALELDPSRAKIHSNLLLNLHYDEPYDANQVYQEHIEWAKAHSASESEKFDFESIDRNPDKRLRIGYVSADLKTHSVSHFFEPLLTAHDKNSFEIFCYSNSLTGDSTTERLKKLADNWREIASLDDNSAASLIYSDAIDILVDLSGHTRHNRMPLFTHKPAPIQVTYIGYPNTAGINEMDYRFTDQWADPVGESEKFYTEELVRLPQGFLCYQPLPSYPDIGPLPFLNTGKITFGSFNNFAKVSPTTISIWAAILSALPESKLFLKSKPLADTIIRDSVKERFKSHGIEHNRLEMLGWTETKSDHMNLYNKVDIALDTFPYNGTTTTCEALWMGVPVISLAGTSHLSRVGLSLLNTAGLTEMVAESSQEYIDKVLELAGDSSRLSKLRASLRERLKASPLTDSKRIAKSIESAYRDMWNRFCL